MEQCPVKQNGFVFSLQDDNREASELDLDQTAASGTGISSFFVLGCDALANFPHIFLTSLSFTELTDTALVLQGLSTGQFPTVRELTRPQCLKEGVSASSGNSHTFTFPFFFCLFCCTGKPCKDCRADGVQRQHALVLQRPCRCEQCTELQSTPKVFFPTWFVALLLHELHYEIP